MLGYWTPVTNHVLELQLPVGALWLPAGDVLVTHHSAIYSIT